MRILCLFGVKRLFHDIIVEHEFFEGNIDGFDNAIPLPKVKMVSGVEAVYIERDSGKKAILRLVFGGLQQLLSQSTALCGGQYI